MTNDDVVFRLREEIQFLTQIISAIAMSNGGNVIVSETALIESRKAELEVWKDDLGRRYAFSAKIPD